MICHTCSSALPDDAKFCRHCGAQTTPVSSTPGPAPIAAAPSERVCDDCESVNPSDAVFCRSCGGSLVGAAATKSASTTGGAASTSHPVDRSADPVQPPPSAPGNRRVLFGLGGLVLIAVVAVVAFVLLTGGGDSDEAGGNLPGASAEETTQATMVSDADVTESEPASPQTTASPAQPEPTTPATTPTASTLVVITVPRSTTSPTTAAPTTVAPTTTIATTTVPATTLPPEESARQRLAKYLVDDTPLIEAVLDQWVPQLSAKYEGLEWQDITWGPVEIAAEHDDLRDRYGAVLVDGGQYNFRSGDEQMVGWFITVVPNGFDNSELALQWCTDNGFGRDDCIAKLVSNRTDIGATTAMNP